MLNSQRPQQGKVELVPPKLLSGTDGPEGLTDVSSGATVGDRRSPLPSFVKPLLAVGRTLRDWWRDLFLMTFVSLAWAALSITIIGGPPAGAALFMVARASILHEQPGMRLFFAALKVYFRRSWALGLVGLLVSVVLLFDLRYYAGMLDGLGSVGLLGAGVLLYAVVVWFQTLMYAWALMVCRDDLKLSQLLRNGFIIALRFAGRNMLGSLFIILLLVIAFYLPPFAILAIPPLVSLLAFHNLYLLAPELAPEDSEAYQLLS